MNALTSISVAAAVFTLAACTQSEAPVEMERASLGPGSVATVNGARLPESLFRLIGLRMLQKNAEDMSDGEREQVLEQLISVQLLADLGASQGIDRERTVAAELELLRMQSLANTTIRRYIEENPPTESELRELYEERVASLSGTEYRARHILLNTREEAENVIGLLDQGGDFAALAQEYSTGPTGPNGGLLDWFSPASMVQPFAEAVTSMEIGSHSAEPVQTQFGWHVILVEDTRQQQAPGIESMREELTAQAERAKMQAYLDSLRAAATIEIVE